MTLAIIFALVIIGLVVWDRFLRFRSSSQDDGSVHDVRVRMRRVESPPRFKGNGRQPHIQGVPQHRRSPRRDAASAQTQRFKGTRRRDPNAIGVACGRPIAECTRGEECLCLD
jgi:hypothetical protein